MWWSDLAFSIDETIATGLHQRIDSGEHDGGSFLIPVPDSQFSTLRLTLRGAIDVNDRNIGLRINGDTSAGLHTSGWKSERFSDGARVTANSASGHLSGLTWRIAHWSQAAGNTAVVDLIQTDEPSFISFQCAAQRVSTNDAFHLDTVAKGRLNATRLLTSLQVVTFDGNQFVGLRWWLDGSGG